MTRPHDSHRLLRLTTLALGLALILAGPSRAQNTASGAQPGGTANAPARAAAAPPQQPAQPGTGQAEAEKCPPDLSKVKIKKVALVPERHDTTRDWVQLRDTIEVTVENLKDLQAQERCLEKAGGERNIILYLDRRPLPDIVGYPPTDPSGDVLMFPLRRTEASRDVWTYLLGRPDLFNNRPVTVSVGIDNQYAVKSDVPLDLRVIPIGWLVFWALLFGTFAVGFFVACNKSDLLRDPVVPAGRARPPFSLSRTQAAWWFFLILGSYLFIGMITGDFGSSITGTVLALLGISAGTAAGSAFVDASKSSLEDQAREAALAQQMQAEAAALDKEIGRLRDTLRQDQTNVAAAQELAAKEAAHADKVSRTCKLTNQSENFLLDILSDTNGVNFHRFQIAAWTVVLGIIFVGHVWRDLAMPEFDATLLGLMGISAGTYLSLKIPENRVQDQGAANAADTAPRNQPPP